MTVSEDLPAIHKSIKDFLSVWLVQRDQETALHSFSVTAFTNQAMFHESCSGYIRDQDRNNREGIKKGIQKFLADITTLSPAKSLDEALDLRPVLLIAEGLKGKAANDVREDRFLILPSRHVELESLATKPEAAKFLKERLASTSFYVSFVPIGPGLAYCIWIREGMAWKIYHASLVCM